METLEDDSERSSIIKVEREPMWDGNAVRFARSYLKNGLSENQCGMETDC